MNTAKKMPIGYYLKKVDNLLTDGINKIHAENGLTRTDWQILNTINGSGNMDRQAISGLLSEFANNETINNAISGLITNGLVSGSKELKLTDKGKEVFRTCLQKQTSFRQKSMQNLTEQEYLQLIATLEKIMDNLT